MFGGPEFHAILSSWLAKMLFQVGGELLRTGQRPGSGGFVRDLRARIGGMLSWGGVQGEEKVQLWRFWGKAGCGVFQGG
jgi:hypothetical protein